MVGVRGGEGGEWREREREREGGREREGEVERERGREGGRGRGEGRLVRVKGKKDTAKDLRPNNDIIITSSLTRISSRLQ